MEDNRSLSDDSKKTETLLLPTPTWVPPRYASSPYQSNFGRISPSKWLQLPPPITFKRIAPAVQIHHHSDQGSNEINNQVMTTYSDKDGSSYDSGLGTRNSSKNSTLTTTISGNYYEHNISGSFEHNSMASLSSNQKNQFEYQHLPSLVSNTSASYMSENTQQTMLSCSQKYSQHTHSSSLPPVNEGHSTSGSGSGGPRLVQKTLAREIELKHTIAQGRFGRVYYGVRHCEEFAVKIYFSTQDSKWKREDEIYQGNCLQHENIIHYLGFDVVSGSGCTELWLITEYHKLGSLYDYLKKKPITSLQQMFSLMRSIIFGLSYLHSELHGTNGNPSIAHGDFKSKNIIMKSETVCCITDFASAIAKNKNQTYRMGTIRYMAPEILNNTLNGNDFGEYLKADIYSLALVFWEIVNRLQLKGFNANEYIRPYERFAPNDDPTLEQMKQIVCVEKQRPYFTEHLYHQHKILPEIIRMITECWLEKPAARLTTLRIKKSIIDFSDSFRNI